MTGFSILIAIYMCNIEVNGHRPCSLHLVLCWEIEIDQFLLRLASSSSLIGKHLRDKHSLAPKDLTKNFSALMKCMNKFDSLLYEMFVIHKLRSTLNVQSDSIRAEVFN